MKSFFLLYSTSGGNLKASIDSFLSLPDWVWTMVSCLFACLVLLKTHLFPTAKIITSSKKCHQMWISTSGKINWAFLVPCKLVANPSGLPGPMRIPHQVHKRGTEQVWQSWIKMQQMASYYPHYISLSSISSACVPAYPLWMFKNVFVS